MSTSETRAHPTFHPPSPCSHLKPLWDFSSPAASAERFAEAARQSADTGDVDCELEALTQLARAQGLEGRFDQGHRTLDEVDARLDATSPGRPGVRSVLERGRLLNSARRPQEAFPKFVEAWELGRKLGDDALAVDAAHMVAIARMEEPEAALEWNHRAIELAQSSPSADAHAWLGSLYNNVGWTHFDRGEHEAALDVFLKAVTLRREQGDPKPILIARWSVAKTLRALGRVDEALREQEQLLADYESGGLEATGFVHEEIAECHRLLGRPGQAALFARAHALLSKIPWLAKNESERLERLRSLSQPAASADDAPSREP